MKCIICHGEEIVDAPVFEEIAVGADIVRIPITVLVCQTCGERYYDRATVRNLERIREEVAEGRRPLEQVGKVLQVRIGSHLTTEGAISRLTLCGQALPGAVIPPAWIRCNCGVRLVSGVRAEGGKSRSTRVERRAAGRVVRATDNFARQSG